MKTKKLTSVILFAVMLIASFVPSTFSWYNHNASVEGKQINLTEDNLPISIKSAASTVSMTTYESDVNGEATDTTVSNISLAANAGKAVKYYKTVFENSGTNDVFADIETSYMPNNADFVIGTVSPTINEKAYASRPVRTKVSNASVRVYFQTNSSFNPYWTHYTGDNATVTFDRNMTNDFNIAYKVSGGNEVQAKLLRCSGTGSSGNDTNAVNTIFYFDLPTNTEYFFFFNHWYYASDSNKEWNRTIDITDLTPGRRYYLTGGTVDGKYKEYAVDSTNAANRVALNQYYSYVRMSRGSGVFADIGLKKDSDTDEDFTPEYYGQSITYRSNNTSIATVNKDGLITPVSAGNTTVTTTITGVHGDFISVTTTVEIPTYIEQVPIIKNVRIPAKDTANNRNGKVEIDWYVKNTSNSDPMTGNNNSTIFFTL